MKKRTSIKNDLQQKNKKKKLLNKSIALNSDSDSDIILMKIKLYHQKIKYQINS